MKDEQKPKSQLIAELKALRQQAARQESLIAEHQRAEEARALHLRFLENMGRVDHIFRQATDIEQMMLDVLQTILEMFEADRAWLLYPCDPEAESWSVPMERTRPEYPGAFALGEEIPMLPEVANVFREALEKGDVLTINHRYQEKVYETAKQFSTLSELYMSIHPLTDKPWMFGLHQCSHYRDWTDEEENLFREIGRRLGDALNSLLILRDLRESEDRFRNLFEQSADCYFVYDLEGRFININTSLLRTYGYSKEEMLTLSVADTHLDAEQGRRVGSATFERLLATGSTQFERAFEKKSGEVFFGQVILSIIDVGGKKLVQGILRDITKHKRAEESLRESEKRYKRLVKSVTDYIYTVKVETGRPISTSHGPGCVAVTGYTTEEYDANPQLWHKMVYEEDRQAVIKQAGSVLAEADVPPLVHRIIHKDGSIRWVQNTPTRRYDEEGRLVAYDGLISNITERKRAEESLRKSEEKYRLLFENMMNGFALHQIVVNEKGKVVDYVFLEINSAFEQLTGLKRNKLIGQKVTEALPGTEKDPADWIGQYGKVALTGQEIRFDQYSQVLGKWYSVLAFSPRKGQFATIFEDITERKQAEESLRESEESLAMAQQVAHIGSWDWNIQDSRLIWSDETYRQFGLKPKEINPTYEAFEGFVHPDDREFINSAVEQALSGQKAYSVEARMIRVDGTEWIMYAQGIVYRNKEGKAVRFIGTQQDITERKQAEEKLKEAELRYKTVADFTYDWESWENPDGTLRYVSPACERITGYTVKQFMDQPALFETIILPADRKIWAKHRHEIIELPGAYEIQFRIRRRDGEIVWIEHACRPVMDEQGAFLGYRASNRDITKRKQAEESLWESERKYRNVIECLPIGMHMYQLEADGNLRFVGANPAADDILQVDNSQYIGKTIFEAFPEISKTEMPERFKIIAEKGGYWHKKNIIYKDELIQGAFENYNFQTSPGQMVSVFMDITERMRAEEERERLLTAEHKQRLLAETLRQITLALTAQTSHQAVLDEILRQAQRLVPYKTANIMLLDAKHNTLQTASWRGYETSGDRELISHLLQPLADLPLVAEAIQSRQSRVIVDTRQEPRWVTLDQMTWIRSQITAPICHQDRVLGLLRLDSDVPGEFSLADAERLQSLANAAAIALENARLYEQAQQDAKTKAILLQEVNHRVKNNLAAIIGILYIEQRHVQQASDRRSLAVIIDDLVNRIEGLVTAHQLLSASNWSPLPLSELTRQIIDSALQALPPDKWVLVDVVAAAPVVVSPKEAHNLAIVINELATNVIKYAAPAKETTQISVRIAPEPDEKTILFEFRDNGPGFPAAVLQSKGRNVGLYLIENTVRHTLRGEIRLHNDNGAVVTIQFAKEMG